VIYEDFSFSGIGKEKQPKADRNDLNRDLCGTNHGKVTDKHTMHCIAVFCAKHFHATLR
jgi:hypothetical protein